MRHLMLGGLAVSTLMLAVLAVQADEEKVPLKDVPKAALKAVKDKFPGAKLTGAEKEKKDGKVTYEIAIAYKGRKIEVHVTPDGKITEIEKEITLKELPKPVADALKEKYPKAKIEKLEEVTAGEKVTYEAHFVVGKKKLEVVFDPSGKVLKVEEEKGKEEKKEEKKEEGKKE